MDDDDWAPGMGPGVRKRRSGYGLIHGPAECDGLPVEVGRIDGQVVAARLEFATGLARLEGRGGGRWVHIGRLRIGMEGAVAVDWRYRMDQGWRREVPLPAGWYEAEAFMADDGCLGIRLVAEHLYREEPVEDC